MDVLLQNIDVNIDDFDQRIYDRDITTVEVCVALHKVSKNKSQGSDGQTMDIIVNFVMY